MPPHLFDFGSQGRTRKGDEWVERKQHWTVDEVDRIGIGIGGGACLRWQPQPPQRNGRMGREEGGAVSALNRFSLFSFFLFLWSVCVFGVGGGDGVQRKKIELKKAEGRGVVAKGWRGGMRCGSGWLGHR